LTCVYSYPCLWGQQKNMRCLILGAVVLCFMLILSQPSRSSCYTKTAVNDGLEYHTQWGNENSKDMLIRMWSVFGQPSDYSLSYGGWAVWGSDQLSETFWSKIRIDDTISNDIITATVAYNIPNSIYDDLAPISDGHISYDTGRSELIISGESINKIIILLYAIIQITTDNMNTFGAQSIISKRLITVSEMDEFVSIIATELN
jgi:hypothetical protein